MNLIDNWKGFYEYGEGYTLPQFGQRVNITVNFQGNNDKFIGVVKEDSSEHAVPLEGRIFGYTEDDFISFVKTYPKNPRLKEEGSSKVVLENGQLEIEHTGFIDAKFDSIYGTWAIIENEMIDNVNYEIIMSGIWMLKRVK